MRLNFEVCCKFLEKAVLILIRCLKPLSSIPCAGNYVKMVHNGIEYGDMQLISEAYDVLKTVGGLTNEELAAVFDEWNKTELESFLVEITASIFKKKDEMAEGFLVDKVLDKTGMKVSKKGVAKE